MEEQARYEVETVRPRTEALVEVEQQRAIAETQAAMLIAKRFPRNIVEALDRIVNACTRSGLAEAALYEYSRGGTDITGPSIRLAEAIAQNWGNLQFGIRELEQRNGESTVEAFAWDIETNTRQVKVFQVAHKRYTKKGTYALEDPRDIYEMVANQGARRLRACILGIVPGDIVETAVKQCETTLKTKADVTPERIASLLEKFSAYKVTKEQIEKRIQKRIEAMTPAQLVNLGKIYNSLKDGMSLPADWFEVEEQKTTTETLKDKLRAVTIPGSSLPELKCPLCSFTTTSERGLKKHTTQSHGQPETPNQPQVATSPEAMGDTSNHDKKMPIPPLVDFGNGESATETDDPRNSIREEIKKYSEVLKPGSWEAITGYFKSWQTDKAEVESLKAMLARCKTALDKQNQD